MEMLSGSVECSGFSMKAVLAPGLRAKYELILVGHVPSISADSVMMRSHWDLRSSLVVMEQNSIA